MARGKITISSVRNARPGDRDIYLWDTDLTGFGLKVTPPGRKVFLVQYRSPTRAQRRNRRITIGRWSDLWTPKAARNEALRLLREVAEGRDPADDRKKQFDIQTAKEVESINAEMGSGAKDSATEERRETFSVPDILDWTEIIGDLPDSVSAALEKRLCAIEEAASLLLRGEALPATPREFTEEDAASDQASLAGSHLNQDQRDSQLWLANQALLVISTIRHWISDGDTSRAADAGLELGLLLAKADFGIPFKAGTEYAHDVAYEARRVG